uniref:Protein BatD n=1 Tax=Magnetococcus massalia (strain MO-1) TaxID=451514 RepID=A0A1S7LI74_MAGMO|nr:protein of unknown function [Candidatus Magnetococcus massalia]
MKTLLRYLCLFLLLPLPAMANPWGQQPWYGGYPGQGQPQQPQYGWPYGGQRPVAPASRKPKGFEPYLEVTASDVQAFVHQNLVVGVEVVTPGNLKKIATQLPKSEAVIFRQLGQPTAEARKKGGRQEIVNRLYYQLTPLQEGLIKLPPISVEITTESGETQRVNTHKNIHLKVYPPDPTVRPWLPLKQLQMSAAIHGDEKITHGKPITLEITQQAIGMTGAQLPSPLGQLRAKDHKLYREGTETTAEIEEGELVGTRVDRFTLVPQQGGRFEIPAVITSWWNVKKWRLEQSIIPKRILQAASNTQAQQVTTPLTEVTVKEQVTTTRDRLIGLIALAFVLGLSSRWLLRKLDALRQWARLQLGRQHNPISTLFFHLLGLLSMRRHGHRLRRGMVNLLPRPIRLWWCVRAADGENDPEDWLALLRFLLKRRLDLNAQEPLSQLAESLALQHPGADRKVMHKLLIELESAMYGGGSMQNFTQWKQRFKQQIRPHPMAWLRIRLPQRGGGEKLQQLNPSP